MRPFMHSQIGSPLKRERSGSLSTSSISGIQRLWIAISIGLLTLVPLALFVIFLIRSSSTLDATLQSSDAFRSASSAAKAKRVDMAATASGVTAASASALPFFVAAPRPRIILFGDSLTERGFNVPSGWAAALASSYSRRADVVNRGLSGYNTRWALRTMPHIFGPTSSPGAAAAGQVLFATLFFGANDAAKPDGPSHSGRQHVSVVEYGENLHKMVSYMREAGVERILLLTPPPIWEAGRKEHQVKMMGEQARDWPLDRTAAFTAEYARAAADVARELQLPCLDLHTLIQQEESWGERLLCDGLHFTGAGQEKLWSLVKDLLDQEWPEIKPEVLKMQFPAWDAINVTDMDATFSA